MRERYSLVRRGRLELILLMGVFLLSGCGALLLSHYYRLGRTLLWLGPLLYVVYRLIVLVMRRSVGESRERFVLLLVMVGALFLEAFEVIPPFVMLVLLGIDIMLIVRQIASTGK